MGQEHDTDGTGTERDRDRTGAGQGWDGSRTGQGWDRHEMGQDQDRTGQGWDTDGELVKKRPRPGSARGADWLVPRAALIGRSRGRR